MPLPAAMNPKLAVPPGAIVPFQVLAKLTCPEVPVRAASHDELIEVPLGRSNATVQPLIVLVVPLVIVYLAS